MQFLEDAKNLLEKLNGSKQQLTCAEWELALALEKFIRATTN